MSYHMQLVLTNSLLILKSTVKGSTLMSCIDLISCYYNIIVNKIAKVDTHRYHTSIVQHVKLSVQAIKNQ